MAVVGPQHVMSAMRDEHVMDTRTPSPMNRSTSDDSPASDNTYRPDLSAEVALLSTKLVNAINFQTNLDDSLQQSRHELEQQRQRCVELEAEKQRHDELVSEGVLVKKAEVDLIIAQLRADLAMEKTAREVAEKTRKQTENEVETLTSALFEEANGMVANARRETEAAERRNAQLKSQLEDSDTLLASQQEQLQDLKTTIERLQQAAPHSRDPSVPTTPITAHAARFDALHISPNASELANVPPEHPLHFSQLISPVLRNDISVFADFLDLLLLGRKLGAHSRANSNNIANQTSPGLNSSPSIPGAFGGISTASSPPAISLSGNASALKESKFYKRALTEDIEPTLRLDLAPGLSFLSRRTVLGSLLQGSLAVEPYPQNKHYFACTLCGESKRGDPFLRKHRFRTSEEDSVSKPLCDYCVSRLRATCDYVGFMRLVRDGHFKCDSEEDQRSAWEESVRLRERMFWARIGGGVVPSFHTLPKNIPPTPSSATGVKSARTSLESIPEAQPKPAKAEDVFQAPARPRSAIGQAIVNASASAATTAMPELQPSQERTQKLDAGFVTPPASRHTRLQSEESQPGPNAPLDDASQDFQTPLEQNNDDRAAPVVQKQVPEMRESRAVEEQQPRPAPSSGTASPEEPSLSIDRPEQTTRKNSSVLNRVRAMEAASSAKEGKSLPGAFE